MSRSKLVATRVTTLLAAALVTWPVFAADQSPAELSNAKRMGAKQLSSACTLLEDKGKFVRMDGLKRKLAYLCGRSDLLGQVEGVSAEATSTDAARAAALDGQVSDPAGETGASQTQSETSIARDENTGVLCSGFNDSFDGLVTGEGFTGFARSTDNGATFTDFGGFDPNSFGDPSLIWRRIDGNFYMATLHNGGLGFYRGSNQCQQMTFLGLAHAGGGDDKEFIAVDNDPSSPFYGRIHLVWIDFNAGARIYAIYSDDATNWTNPVQLSANGASVQGAWPAVAPDGTVYVSWVRFGGSTISIEASRSTNGGDNWTTIPNAATSVAIPEDQGATNACGRTALKGNLRYLPSPQIVVSPDGALHAVYTYDPDGNSNGNESDVFYRRSTNGGNSWLPEIRLNDDGTQTDQYFPTISVSPGGRLVVAWYDRRLDANNLRVDYYATMSSDGGATWEPNERISDESSDIYLDPNLASCYHGDYDQSVQDAETAFIQWSDDRAIRSGHADPDVYLEAAQFASDFFLTSTPTALSVCAPDDAAYSVEVGQTLDFTDAVTFSASGEPAGTSANFSPNPVTPGNSTVMTIANTAAGTPGDYTIDVNGNAAGLDRSVSVALNLATQAPAAAGLISPAQGASDVGTPTYTWSPVAQAASYTVEVATDAAFTNIVDSATVEQTSYASGVALAPSSTFFWRVRASNACGAGVDSATFSFTTVSLICNTTVTSIPDGQGAGVDISTVVANGGTITDLDVSLSTTHTYVGDLIFTLTHNTTGTSVVLIDRPGFTGTGFGCDDDDVEATMDDEASLPVEDECGSTPALAGLLIPQEALSAFDGEDIAGQWTLNVSDNAGQDTGSVQEWCLVPALMIDDPDTDGDSVPDSADNCSDIANPTQADGDADGIGNLCDADLTNDCVINFEDLSILKAAFFTSDPVADLNGDGDVNFLDLSLMKAVFFGEPGPSGVPNVCDN